MRLHVVILLTIFLGIMAAGAISCSGGGSDISQPPDIDPTTPLPFPDDDKIPDPPGNVAGIAGDRMATITWDRVFSATGYRIYQSEDGVTFIRLTSSVEFTENTSIIRNLINGEVYYFGVTAVDERSNESGIAYIGGSPTAFQVKPSPPVDPDYPDPPSNVGWYPGDRELMITWNHSNFDLVDYFTIDRNMHISPYAAVPGDTPKERAEVIANYESVFKDRFYLGTVFDPMADDDPRLNGFTLPTGPYYIDSGVHPVGLPPNYLPFGLASGDILYEYKLAAWMYGYSAYALPIDCVPCDYPPEAPVLLSVFLVPNTAGDGVGVYLEWTQPLPPYNSDIRNYILSRMEGTDILGIISIIIESPYNASIASVSYQDDAVIPGDTYSYQIRAQDFSALTSPASNILAITIPGGEPPPPPPPPPDD